MTDAKTESFTRILIVDDDDIDREAVKRCLKNIANGRRYEIAEAACGEDALARDDLNTFDCIFLDYMLPDMDGLGVLDRLYNDELDLAPSPIVMLTGRNDEELMLNALRKGAQDFLIKDNLTPALLKITMIKARGLFDLKKKRGEINRELQYTRRMEAIGQLTSGIAHDFNNLLTVILGNTRLIRRRIAREPETVPWEDVDKKIEAIETVTNKGADLIRRLMIFSRQNFLATEVANLNTCLDEALTMVGTTLGRSIEIETSLEKNLWPVLIDVGEFENALINLMVNARDAMPDGGKIAFKTANVNLVDNLMGQAGFKKEGLPYGEWVAISVSDTGQGIPPETQQRIFEPFFTTKPSGHGTGLGLSMVYGFIKQSNGFIFVESEPGHGASFHIFLPPARAA